MYTASLVERLLKNYADIRSYLGGSPVPARTSLLTGSKPVQAVRERPFGMRFGDETWPFMEVPHANPPPDGKRRARSIEDMHCGVIDLEQALAKLNAREYALVRSYYIEGGRTFEEIATEFGYQGRESARTVCWRVVCKLASIMENNLYDVEEV